MKGTNIDPMIGNQTKINSILKYLFIGILTFSIIAFNLDSKIIKAEGNHILIETGSSSPANSRVSVEWIYNTTADYLSSSGSSLPTYYMVECHISFDNYYTGYITLRYDYPEVTNSTLSSSYQPTYLCQGARVVSPGTARAGYQIEFVNVNELSINFYFTYSDLNNLNSSFNNYVFWVNSGENYFTLTSVSAQMQLADSGNSSALDYTSNFEEIENYLSIINNNVLNNSYHNETSLYLNYASYTLSNAVVKDTSSLELTSLSSSTLSDGNEYTINSLNSYDYLLVYPSGAVNDVGYFYYKLYGTTNNNRYFYWVHLDNIYILKLNVNKSTKKVSFNGFRYNTNTHQIETYSSLSIKLYGTNINPAISSSSSSGSTDMTVTNHLLSEILQEIKNINFDYNIENGSIDRSINIETDINLELNVLFGDFELSIGNSSATEGNLNFNSIDKFGQYVKTLFSYNSNLPSASYDYSSSGSKLINAFSVSLVLAIIGVILL